MEDFKGVWMNYVIARLCRFSFSYIDVCDGIVNLENDKVNLEKWQRVVVMDGWPAN